MRIVMDLDEVLYDFEGASRFLLEEHHGIVVPKPSTHWTYAKDYCREVGHPEAWEWLWTEGVAHGLFRHGHVLRGAFRAMHSLDKAGHRLVVITSRPRSASADTLEWLGYHRMPVSEVHVLGPKTPKTSVKPYGDLYVDDSPHNIDDVLTETSRMAVLFDRPWNQDYSPPIHAQDRFVRAYGWEDVHQAVQDREVELRVGGWV